MNESIHVFSQQHLKAFSDAQQTASKQYINQLTDNKIL